MDKIDKLTRHCFYRIKQSYELVWRICFILGCIPLFVLIGQWGTDSLGINPLNHLLHFSGITALILMLITLSVTPLRRLSVVFSIYTKQAYGKRLSDWNWMIKLRRQFGLFAFFYASLHFLFYLWLDVGLDLQAMLEDIQERPFIMLGFIAYLLLLPLAATSNSYAIRELGGNWQTLHKLSYVIIICETAHYYLQMKLGQTCALPYIVYCTVVLSFRIWAWLKHDRDSGVEVQERSKPSALN